MIYNKVTPKITVLSPGEKYNPANSGAYKPADKVKAQPKPSEYLKTKYKELGSK